MMRIEREGERERETGLPFTRTEMTVREARRRKECLVMNILSSSDGENLQSGAFYSLHTEAAQSMITSTIHLAWPSCSDVRDD